jgi:hypothetical protein
MSAPEQASGGEGAGRPDLANLIGQIDQIESGNTELRQYLAANPSFVSPRVRRELLAMRRAVQAMRRAAKS